nr:hypothetical protein GCM10020092_093430 [Actinoplanes digitatis]
MTDVPKLRLPGQRHAEQLGERLMPINHEHRDRLAHHSRLLIRQRWKSMCLSPEAKAYQQSDSTREPSRSGGTPAVRMRPSGRHNSYLRWTGPLAFGVRNDAADACRAAHSHRGSYAMYEIQLFGRLEVRTRGVRLTGQDFGGEKPRQILALLALRGETNGAELAELLWSGRPPAQPPDHGGGLCVPFAASSRPGGRLP